MLIAGILLIAPPEKLSDMNFIPVLQVEKLRQKDQ